MQFSQSSILIQPLLLVGGVRKSVQLLKGFSPNFFFLLTTYTFLAYSAIVLNSPNQIGHLN